MNTSHASCRCFDDTRIWIFDLDNTLYPAECNLFPQVAERMNAFIMRYFAMDADAAARIRRDYYLRYGTTLAGLMEVDKLDPEPFLEFVHDIDHSVLAEHPELASAIARLPGRRFIFTNGSRRHAEQVAEKIGVLHLFEEIYDITAAGYVPKPHRDAYELFLKSHEVTPHGAAMFEDLPHNLETAHDLGMTTVLVRSTYDDHPSQGEIDGWQTAPAHIHHITRDLAAFLQTLGPLAGAEDTPAG